MRLNRAEALATAVKTVDEILAKVPIKSDGWNGWKAPSFAERVEAIMDMAEFLRGPEEVTDVPESPESPEGPEEF